MAKEETSLFGLTPSDIAARAEGQMEDLANLQGELFDKLQEANRQWLDRIEAEAKIASEFTTKLTQARSFPEVVSACQVWANRRFELLGEDTKHFIDDTQKFIQTGAHFLAISGQSKELGVKK
jgi:Phasin protein